jgi:hypothetical protein
LFVKKVLSGGNSLLAGGLLAFVGSTLVKEALAGCRLEAMALVLPHGVNSLLPIPVGAFRAGSSPMKNGPHGWVRRQYPSSLLVFANGSLMPFFVAKGATNIGWGIVVFIAVNTQLGARGAGYNHLYCRHAEGLEREDEDK